jgi:hypothetical protein
MLGTLLKANITFWDKKEKRVVRIEMNQSALKDRNKCDASFLESKRSLHTITIHSARLPGSTKK